MLLLPLFAVCLVVSPHHLTRAEFKKGIDRIDDLYQLKPLTAEDVQKVLGPPDDVWQPGDTFPLRDVYRFNVADGWDVTVWGYGADHHLGFPAVGYLVFRSGFYETRSLTEVVHTGYMPESQLVEEVRKLDKILFPRGRFNQDHPGPLEMIRAVNDLIPLGRDKALEVVEQYSNVVGYGYKDFICALITCLFTDGGCMSKPLSNEHLTLVSSDDHYGDRVLVQNDVPVQVFQQSAMGDILDAESFIDHYKADGSFRTKPLHPTDNVLSLDTNRFQTFSGYELSTFQAMQSVFRTVVPRLDTSRRVEDRNYAETIKYLQSHPIIWDTKRQLYTMRNGTFLPLKQTPLVRPVRLDLPLENGQGQIKMMAQRTYPGEVDLLFGGTSCSLPPEYMVEVVNLEDKTTLLKISIPDLKVVEVTKKSMGEFSADNPNDFYINGRTYSHPWKGTCIPIPGKQALKLLIQFTLGRTSRAIKMTVPKEPVGFEPSRNQIINPYRKNRFRSD